MAHESIVYDRRVRLIEYAARVGNVAEACRVFGVSRNTYYEWIKKAEQYGLSALLPRDRRQPHQPNAMSSEEVAVILAEAITRPTLGPKSLLRHLRARGAAGYLRGVTSTRPLTHAAASVGGAVLSGGTRALAAVRPAAKPLHPVGRVVVARLRRVGSQAATGIAFLDGAGEDRVLVRESRAIGLPTPLPDVHGLAIRVTNPDGSDGDLLLATTGWGRVTRFVLTASVTPYGRPLTTLLPYRTDLGPLLLGARHSGFTDPVELAYAVGTGVWLPFAELMISEEASAETTISFDPVVHPVTGLDQYTTVHRLREPAYRAARRARTQS